MFIIEMLPTLDGRKSGERGGRYEAEGDSYDDFADNMIDVLERALRVRRVDLQAALRVAGHLVGAHRPQTVGHGAFGAVGAFLEVDLVLLDDPPGQVARLVGHQLVNGRERFDGSDEVARDAARGGHEFVVEEMIDGP